MLIEFMTSKFFFVIPMILGGLTYWGITRYASFGTGITKGAAARELLKDGNIAVALYLGLRDVAIAIAVGSCVIAGTSV